MPSYSDIYVRDLLDAFSSTAPAPGGGAAAALTGALGVSLLLMALGIRSSKAGGLERSSELAGAVARLRSLRPAIAALIDRDANAYSSVISALRMPLDDAAARARRQAACDLAMRAATEVPLETMRACRLALGDAPIVAAQSIRSTTGDVGVAIELLRAAVRAAGVTIDANLGALKDADYVSVVTAERQRLDAESAVDAEHGLSLLSGRSG
jgi:methenyltetrahydrofolate cyclohydrolase